MRLLVTGATGFVGSNLIQRLNPEEVHILVRHVPTRRIPSGVKVHLADILDFYSLRRVIREVQPTHVIHLAALTPVRYSFHNPWAYSLTNFTGTMNMVHASLESPVLERFIQASTAEVYAPSKEALKEEDSLSSATPYAVSKVGADLYVQMAMKCYGLPATILRPANTYGRTTEFGYVVEKTLTTMLKGEDLYLDGSPEAERDFMFVSDHVNAYLKALEANKDGVYNIGRGKAVSIRVLVELCKTITNYKGQVSYQHNPRPYDPPKLVLNPTKAQRELNWRAEVELEEGLRRTVELLLKVGGWR